MTTPEPRDLAPIETLDPHDLAAVTGGESDMILPMQMMMGRGR